jgi:hypothetical protein
MNAASQCLHFGKAWWQKSERHQKIMLRIEGQIYGTKSLVYSTHISALWGQQS